ncbi:MAG: NUDIX hydrolase [Candidatus Andersenbacteria bacterium]
MLFATKPKNFQPIDQIVTMALLVGPQVLVLYRHPEKPHPLRWSLPGGKVKRGVPITRQLLLTEALREVKEETGIVLSVEQCDGPRSWFIRYPEGDYQYHQFVVRLADKPEVMLNPVEHVTHRWPIWEQLLQMKYIEDLDGVLRDIMA